MKHVKTLNTKRLQNINQKVVMASARHPASLHAKHPVYSRKPESWEHK